MAEESCDGLAEMGGGCVEGWKEVRRELVWRCVVRRRGGKRRDVKVMEMDVLNGVWVPTLDSDLGLAVVSGGTDEVDRNVVGGDEAGEVEELVEMALCR